MHSSIAALSVALLACNAPAPPHSQPPPSSPAEPIPEEPAQAPASVGLRSLRVGFGGAGVSAAHAPTPGWVIGAIELHAASAVTALELVGVTVYDDAGQSVGNANRELELRIAPPDRSNGDFSRHGTFDFDGSVADGDVILLWLHARFDDDFNEVMVRRPTRFEARFADATGGEYRVMGELEGPWPTG